MGEIIAVVSGKGGTGKTTFTSNVGFALASLGKKVLCLDCDITLRNLDLALGLSDSALMDFSDVMGGRCTLEEAVVRHPKYPSLFLLAAPLVFDGFRVDPTQVRTLMGQIKESYDFCLVDAPAGLGQGFRMATQEADHVVVVTTTDVTALRDAQRTVMELDRFPTDKVHLVVNRVARKLMRQLHTTIDDAMDAAGLPLLGVVPEDPDIPRCLNQGVPLRDDNFYAARAYYNIAKRIAGGRAPLMKL